MRVTDMRRAEVEGNVKAFFRIETQEGVLIDGFKIVNGRNGLFVSSPSRKIGEKFIETVTIPKDLKAALTKTALEEYQNIGPAPESGPGDGEPPKSSDLPF